MLKTVLSVQKFLAELDGISLSNLAPTNDSPTYLNESQNEFLVEHGLKPEDFSDENFAKTSHKVIAQYILKIRPDAQLSPCLLEALSPQGVPGVQNAPI